jgi:hypothetical protein
MTVNPDGVAHARQLIADGKVDKSYPWGFSADDGNRILGDPPDWAEYRKWFLGRREEEDPETKAAWAYPYGKNGKVYRSGLIAAKARAAQQGHAEIARAADRLLAMVDGEKASRLVSCAMVEAAATGQWVQLLPWGVVRTLDGREFVFDEQAAAAVMAAWDARFGDLAVDYDHQSLNPLAPRAPAAGWIVELEVRAPAEGEEPTAEHGLWGMVEWTPAAQQHLAQKEYRYISPVVYVDDEWRVEELVGAALTNSPAIDGMAAAASRRLREPSETGGEEMNEEHVSVEEYRAAVERAEAAQRELDALRERLRQLEEERALSEVAPLATEEQLAFGRELFRKAPELFGRWAEMLKKTAPPTERLERPSPVDLPTPPARETFPGEAKVLSLARRIAEQKGVPMVDAVMEAAAQVGMEV